MNFPFAFVALAVIAALASLLLTEKLRLGLLKRAMLDIPNERSSHKQPVPRGGGIAVMGVVLTGMLAMLGWNPSSSHAAIFAAAALLVGVSLYDDRKGASAGLRFGAHLLAAGMGAASFASDQLLLGGLAPLWLDRAVMAIGWAWFMNLYNFMDGIDGITGVETIAICMGIAVLPPMMTADGFALAVAALLIGGMAGFLRHNWHPARIFLGDSGSVPLGFLVGYLLILLAVKGFWASALILPLYYLADSGITITRRLLRGEKIWQAHRQHFYQRAALGAGRHDRVALWVLAANLALIGAALLGALYPATGLALAIVIVAILLVKMHKSGNVV